MKRQSFIVVALILTALIITLEGCTTAQPPISSTLPSSTKISTVLASATTSIPTNLPTIRPTLTPAASPTPVGGGSGRIAFTSDLDGDFEIYTMNIDGSNRMQLTKNYAWDCCASWSPDGTRIV